MCSMFPGGWRRRHSSGQDDRPLHGNSGFRQDFPGRNPGLSLFHSTHHDSSRTRLQRSRQSQRVNQSYQRQHRASIGGGLLVVVALMGCQRAIRPSPTATYQKIYAEFLRGDLGIAARDAEKARREFSERGRSWDIKFRLLEAEILTYQGNSQRVVQLLADYRPTPFAAPDIEIKRQLLLSWAHTRLNQANQSNHELQTAQQLCREHDSALQGEVLQTEGLIEFHRDQLDSAAKSFERSLEFARQRGDKLLETNDLINLGTVSLHYEEYDEALSRFEDASQIALATGARLELELALGNAGWAYYKLGDFEKSLFNFQQAEQQARELGLIHYQIVWATDTGLSFYRLGDMKSAEANYRRALSAAQAVNDTELIAATHTELG